MTLVETAKSTVRNAMDQGRETTEKAGQAVKGGYKATLKTKVLILAAATSCANRG